MKDSLMESDILSALVSSINEITVCGLCKNSTDVTILFCGHVCCKPCVEKNRKSSVYVVCKICNRSIVYKDNDRRNDILVLLNKFKAEISQNKYPVVLCKQLVSLFDNQDVYSPTFVVPATIDSERNVKNKNSSATKTCVSKSENTNKNESTINKLGIKTVSNQCTSDEIQNPFPGWDTINDETINVTLCKDIKERPNDSKDSEQKMSTVNTKDNITGRKRFSSSFSNDGIKKCKFDRTDENGLNVFEKVKSGNETNINIEYIGEDNSEIKDKTIILVNDASVTSTVENIPNNIDEKINLSLHPDIENQRNSVLPKRFSSKIPNNRTMDDLRRNFNVPSPPPLLIQKSKKKMLKTDLHSTDSLKGNKSVMNVLDNVEEGKNLPLDVSFETTKASGEKLVNESDNNDLLVDSSLKARKNHREVLSNNENHSTNEQFELKQDYIEDKNLDSIKYKPMETSKLTVEKQERSEEVFPTQKSENMCIETDTKSSLENNRNENTYYSVACQTTSDLHKDLLYKEFPELLANLSSIVLENDRHSNELQFFRNNMTPACGDMKTPIDSGNGKSIIVSSVTSSERKNFNEHEFIDKSVIRTNDFWSTDKNTSGEVFDKTLRGSNIKIVSRKRSLKFDNHDMTINKVQISASIENDCDADMTGITLLDKDPDMLTTVSDRSICNDDKNDKLQNTTNILNTPECKQFQNATYDDDDAIASTPTTVERLFSSDGTMDKLMNRSTSAKLDSANSSTVEKEENNVSYSITCIQDENHTTDKSSKTSNKTPVVVNESISQKEERFTIPKKELSDVPANAKDATIPSVAGEKLLIGNKLCLVTSGLNQTEVNSVKMLAKKLSMTWSSIITADTTHLIMKVDENNHVVRTLKYFQALSKPIPVVSIKWIERCFRKNKIVKEEHYMPLDFSGECGPFRSYLAYRGLGNSLDWARNYCICLLKPYPANCPLPNLQELIRNMGSVFVRFVEEFRKYPKHHNVIIVADEVGENDLDREQINEWLETYNAVTVHFSWLIEVIGRYRAVSFSNFQLSHASVFTLLGKHFPIYMVINEDTAEIEL